MNQCPLSTFLEKLYFSSIKDKYEEFFSLSFYTGGGELKLLEYDITSHPYGAALMKGVLCLPNDSSYVGLVESARRILEDLEGMEKEKNYNAVLFGPILNFDRNLKAYLEDPKRQLQFKQKVFEYFLSTGKVVANS